MTDQKTFTIKITCEKCVGMVRTNIPEIIVVQEMKKLDKEHAAKCDARSGQYGIGFNKERINDTNNR